MPNFILLDYERGRGHPIVLLVQGKELPELVRWFRENSLHDVQIYGFEKSSSPNNLEDLPSTRLSLKATVYEEAEMGRARELIVDRLNELDDPVAKGEISALRSLLDEIEQKIDSEAEDTTATGS